MTDCPDCTGTRKRPAGHDGRHTVAGARSEYPAEKMRREAKASGVVDGAAKVAFPEYTPPKRPATGPGARGQIQGGVMVPTSGIWKNLAAFENEFLERGKCSVSAEQEAAMDANVQALTPGVTVNPWWGLGVGVFIIYVFPILTEIAPILKHLIKEKYKEIQESKEKEEEKKRREGGVAPVAEP